MLRRLTILAIVIWLVAGIPRAMGQDWKYGPSPPLIATSTERGAVTVAVSADYSIPKPATVPYQPQIQIPQPSQSILAMPDPASLIPSVLPPVDNTPTVSRAGTTKRDTSVAGISSTTTRTSSSRNRCSA